MTTLREAAQQALEALEAADVDPHSSDAVYKAITALRAALVEGGGNLPPPLQEPKDFDHAIGADRFKVVRGAFWWHVLIGDSPTEHGKFRSRASAEKMAADLLREFRNGAFVQHDAALAEPDLSHCPNCASLQDQNTELDRKLAEMERKPLTEEEIERLLSKHERDYDMVRFARAVERAHGIK